MNEITSNELWQTGVLSAGQIQRQTDMLNALRRGHCVKHERLADGTINVTLWGRMDTKHELAAEYGRIDQNGNFEVQ